MPLFPAPSTEPELSPMRKGILADFKALITELAGEGMRFIIICGGGKTARQYQEAAARVSRLRPEDIDWMGIHATRLNAQLVKTLFLGMVHERVIHDPTETIAFTEPVLIAAGWKPGFSTDYDAVMLAKNFGVKTVVNLSNIDYVYDKHPGTNGDAKPFKRISWPAFRKVVGDRWDPGLNAPFDPVAAAEAEASGISVVVMQGTDIENIRRFLKGGEFRGTVIQ